MILKPKSVFFENENKIGIDMTICYGNIFGCARFKFGKFSGRKNSKVERAFRKGMCSALKSFAKSRGIDIKIDESKIKPDLVFIGINDFDDRYCGMLGFFEKETEKVLADYFRNNEEIAEMVLRVCHPSLDPKKSTIFRGPPNESKDISNRF